MSWRYAVKKFDPTKKVSPENINTLLEAMQLSPSSFGLQGWKIVIVEDSEKRKELVPHSWNQQQVIDASHLFVLCRTHEMSEEQIVEHGNDTMKARSVEWEDIEGYVNLVKSYTENMEPHAVEIWLSKQLYIMLGYLMATCSIMKIDSCPMEGFNPKEYDRILDLEAKGLNSVLVVPVGYRAEEDIYASYKKVRRSLEDIVLKI